jgi:L-ascorbate metabolism protein UlaG (beta-lactamase superfamily)
MIASIQTAVTFQLLAGCSLSQPSDQVQKAGTGLHYRPLGGATLESLVADQVHHGNARFINPFSTLDRRNFGRILKWKLFTENKYRNYYEEEQVIETSIAWQEINASKDLSITLIKHAGLLIKDVDSYLLIDPVFDKIFWFIKDFTPLTNIAEMPSPDHLLITHGHYDHFDLDSLSSLPQTTHVLAPLGYGRLFHGLGMENRVELDWFSSWADKEREIHFLPCNHWTMRNPIEGPNTGLWGSYLIRTKAGATIYISGDTAFFDGFDELGQRFAIDLAIFNLGAYEPRGFMAPSHMNPQETYLAYRQLGARHLMLAHWGSFRLGDEPVHFPPLDMQVELRKHGAEAELLEAKHGKTLYYQ